MRFHQRLLITGFGLGYLRPAPGTWSSLPPVAMVLLLLLIKGAAHLDVHHVFLIDLPLAGLAAMFTLLCLRWGDAAENHFARKDAPSITADEVAGQSIALLFLPWKDFGQAGAATLNLLLALVAFGAFRLTDIIKPPPARSLQRFHGGLGIVLDDLIAGLYALILAQLAAHFIILPLAA